MGNRSRYREKSPYRYPLNDFGSLFALIMLLLILYSVVVIPLMDSLVGMGEIITDFIELFPFGEVSYAAAIGIINAIVGQGVNYASIQGVFSFAYLVQELLEGIFTVIIFNAARLLMTGLMDLADPNVRGFWNSIKRVVLDAGLAILAACFAPALINYIFSSMGMMSFGWKTAISSLVSIILVSGGVGFFLFFFGITFLSALGYMLISCLLIGGARLFTCYVCIFCICVGIHLGIFSMIFGGMGGLLVVVVMLAGIEKMLEGVFGIGD